MIVNSYEDYKVRIKFIEDTLGIQNERLQWMLKNFPSENRYPWFEYFIRNIECLQLQKEKLFQQYEIEETIQKIDIEITKREELIKDSDLLSEKSFDITMLNEEIMLYKQKKLSLILLCISNTLKEPLELL